MLAIIDIVPGQLLQRPIVQRLVQRFVADQIMVRQRIKPIGQPFTERPWATPHNHYVQELPLRG